MNPAPSVIFFTTLSGLGYGLAFWLSLARLLHPELASAPWYGGVGLGAALVLIVSGLLSSTFHLGHPERAWRAVSQWRTSWLSREGVAALVSLPLIGLEWLGWATGETGGLWTAIAVLAAISAVVTVHCTGMIYQSLKPVAAWTSSLTTPVYLLYAAMTGAFAAAALSVAFGQPAFTFTVAAVALAPLLAWAKFAYWKRARGAGATTPETATGLGRIGTVRQLEAPHVTENYITREMGFRVARAHAERLRKIAVGLGLALPLVLGLCAFWVAPVLLWPAAVAALVGAIVERWLFFAEAKHAVTAYYGDR